MSKDDEELILHQAKGGDRRAFEKLLLVHQKHVYNTLYLHLYSHESAEDLTQEVFIQVYKHLDSYDDRAKFSTWLHRITLNTLISHYRRINADKRGGNKTKHSLQSFGDETIHENQRLHKEQDTRPESIAENKELEQRIRKAISNLEQEQREVIILREIEGYDYKEIADLLDIKIGTVRSRIHRGREKLRELLADLLE